MRSDSASIMLAPAQELSQQACQGAELGSLSPKLPPTEQALAQVGCLESRWVSCLPVLCPQSTQPLLSCI